MITIDELQEQNHYILERSRIILYMIQDRTICDSGVTCDLFFDLTDKIKEHMDLEERELYKDLLINSDHEIKQLAENFLSGSAEVKRIFKQYKKKWCHNKELRIKNHTGFIAATNDLFDMVQLRIINETEKFYPVIRKVQEAK